MNTVTITYRVTADADDSYEINGNFANNDPYFVPGGQVTALHFSSAALFRNVTIPAGATIVEAFITLTGLFTRTGQSPKCLIKAEKAAVPAAYGVNEDYTVRTYTTASVAWDVPADIAVDESFDTPDLKSLINELLAAYSPYTAGVMAFKFSDNGTVPADSYQIGRSHNSSPTYAPLLTITYAFLSLNIGFASNPFANPQTWTNVTADAQTLSTKRGRQHALDRIESGTASFVLKNQSNQYWPDNAASPYNTAPCSVKPGKCIKLQATYGGVIYDLYYGFVESWQPGWQSVGGVGPITTLECADLIKNLSRHKMTNAGFAAQLSGTRIDNVLDDIGWPVALMDLDAGQTTIQASGALVNANAMEHLFLVRESERGQFFITGAGVATFHDRHARFIAPLNTSQATFGDDAGENKYRAIEPAYDDQFIYNTVSTTRLGGAVQTATDAASKTAYGPRSLSNSGLLMPTDAEALSQSQYLLSQYKDAALRTKQLIIYPQADPVNLWPKVLGYDIGTRITLRLNQASLDKDYHIEGISHDYDIFSDLWVTTWQLSDADIAAYWALGIAGLGELGEVTKLCY